MSKHIKLTSSSLVMAAVCWGVLLITDLPWVDLFSALAAIAFSFVFVGLLIVGIFKRFSDKTSPYRVFAIVNGIVGIFVSIYAIYDIQTDTGWFAGLVGTLLLVFVMPIILLLLLIDFILWRRNRKL